MRRSALLLVPLFLIACERLPTAPADRPPPAVVSATSGWSQQVAADAALNQGGLRLLRGHGASVKWQRLHDGSRRGSCPGCETRVVEPVVSLGSAYFFESMVGAPDGSVYTSEQCSGDVVRISPHGNATVVATIPYGVDNSGCDAAGTLGLARSKDGAIWVVVLSWVPQSHGVWKIGSDGSLDLAVPMPPDQAVIPNAITFDSRGNLYITESYFGSVWKAGQDRVASVWLESDLLTPPPDGFFGANGIEYQYGDLYIANTDRGTIVRVAIGSDGSPGQPQVVATGLVGVDDIIFQRDHLYALSAYDAMLFKVGVDGSQTPTLDLGASGVSYPTGIAFGGMTRNTAYIANFVPSDGEANVVKVDLCEGTSSRCAPAGPRSGW